MKLHSDVFLTGWAVKPKSNLRLKRVRKLDRLLFATELRHIQKAAYLAYATQYFI